MHIVSKFQFFIHIFAMVKLKKHEHTGGCKKTPCISLASPINFSSFFFSKDGDCRFKKAHVGATVSGFVDIESGDEDALKAALATVGPVSVAIDASRESFQFYSNGTIVINQ